MNPLKLVKFLIIVISSCVSSVENADLLYAYREAPIGGEYLKLKHDNTFEHGPIRSTNISTGTFEIHGDTLVLNYEKMHRKELSKYFSIKSGRIMSLGKKSAPLEIKYNNIKQ